MNTLIRSPGTVSLKGRREIIFYTSVAPATVVDIEALIYLGQTKCINKN